ncbi:hypothetical protein D3C85_1822390 [compost metagenome]
MLLLVIQATAVTLHQTKMPRHVAMQVQVRAYHAVELVAFRRGFLPDAFESSQQLLVELFDQVE